MRASSQASRAAGASRVVAWVDAPLGGRGSGEAGRGRADACVQAAGGCGHGGCAATGDLQTGKCHPRVVGWFSIHAQYRVGFLDRISQNHYW